MTMNMLRGICISVVLATSAATAADPPAVEKPLTIGSRRELFVDDWLIAKMQGAHLALQKPERREVVFTFDAAWEDCSAWPIRAIKVGDVFRIYYRASCLGPGDDNSAYGMVESRDGVTFTRPRLGLRDFKGSRENNLLNNLLDAGKPAPKSNMPPPFQDTNPKCPPELRYKGLATGEWQVLWACGSPDGIAWRKLHEGKLDYPGTFDTVTTAFWDTIIGRYRSYTRFFTPGGVRAIETATSEDFIHWTKPEPLVYADGDYQMQLYTNAIQPCPGAEHIYVGFPNRFMEQRKLDPKAETGMNDALFMSSRDGVRWTRYLAAWVKPGLDPLNWTHRNNYPVWGIVETSPTEWSMYITEHYAHKGLPTRIRRLAVRPHGFAAVHADYSGGEMTTKPLTFAGKALTMNFATSAAGSIRVEIQDAAGRPIPGFALDDCPEIFGDRLNHVVAWKQQSDVSKLAGKPIRVRFVMKDADLFTIRFQ
jgi:hypothetical protein